MSDQQQPPAGASGGTGSMPAYIRIFGKLPNGITDERLKIILGFRFGYLVLGGVIFSIGVVGIGQVKAETSYGLLILLNALSFLGGGFTAWAFGHKGTPESGESPQASGEAAKVMDMTDGGSPGEPSGKLPSKT